MPKSKDKGKSFAKKKKEPTPELESDSNEELDQDVDESDGNHNDIDDEDQESDTEKRTEIRKELSNLTFEELVALREKLGLKVYEEAMFGKKSLNKSTLSSSSKNIKTFIRDNKNRPRELSSKIRVPKVREVSHVPKKRTRDPRFENLCGDYDETVWKSNYQFITEMQDNETKDLKEKLKDNVFDKDKEKEVRKHLQKVREKEKSEVLKKKEKDKQKLEREENIKRLKEGKKPYYMKKSTRKYVELVDKYEELKASGKLEKYLKKKRTKNAIRDKKTLKMTK